MKKVFLEVVVFVCGAVLMAFEILGSRMLGPSVGTSMFVWTSIIGVILLSLSLGYYWGGKIADKRPEAKPLAFIILLAAIFIVLSTLIKEPLLNFLLGMISSVKIIAILSSLLLFSIPSVLLGMVSPYAARIKIKSVEKSGATAGYLYAISTVGSILGVFLTGFYLIPSFRLSKILILLSVILIFVSIFLHIAWYFTTKDLRKN